MTPKLFFIEGVDEKEGLAEGQVPKHDLGVSSWKNFLNFFECHHGHPISKTKTCGGFKKSEGGHPD